MKYRSRSAPGRRRWLLAGAAAIVLGALSAPPLAAAETVKLGLVAALSGPSAQSGEAITRGLSVAIDEINAAGGILGGRMIELIRRDDESNPPKGVIAARELIYKEKVAAFFGGIDSPVSLAIVPLANKAKVPFMGDWAAATPITRNGAKPNYVFRVSAVDAIVDIKLLQYALKTFGASKVGLMLINNPWGESNEKGLKAADAINDAVEIVGVEKFENNDVDMIPQLTRHKERGAEALVLVTNAPPGAQMMKSRERMGWDVPVVSHWGISGGRFPELAGRTAGDVHFVQTYSFFGEQSAVGKAVLAALVKKFPKINGPEDVFSPVGTANAYDAMHLMAKAIDKAGSTDGDAIREALENLGRHEGLIKTYDKPFSADNHDALNENDYIMVRFVGNTITPME
ncbi:MAG: ABC transporter substrate-binding protein [Alphaproteobacteria bacterium]